MWIKGNEIPLESLKGKKSFFIKHTCPLCKSENEIDFYDEALYTFWKERPDRIKLMEGIKLCSCDGLVYLDVRLSLMVSNELKIQIRPEGENIESKDSIFIANAIHYSLDELRSDYVINFPLELEYDTTVKPKYSVDVRQHVMDVDSLVSMISDQSLELFGSDNLQSLPKSWDQKRNAQLIESLLMQLPLPMIFLDGSQKPWRVVDGEQRLLAMYHFIHTKLFELNHLDFLKNYQGKSFDQLTYSNQRLIKTTKIQVCIINPGTSIDAKLNIYKRIGENRSRQEIRTACFDTGSIDFLRLLARSKEFKAASNFMISEEKQYDIEFVIRFIAFYLFIHVYGYKLSLERFLDFATLELEWVENKAEIKKKFETVMNACSYFWGKDPFQLKQNCLNIALFDTVSVNFAKLNENELQSLKNKKNIFLERYDQLIQTPVFIKSITSRTSSKNAVTIRFNLMSDLIRSCMD